MKSIKPGRGPSFMGAFAYAFVAAFGVLWTILAASITRGIGGIVSVIFPLFGVIFVCLAIGNAIYNYKNATSKNRYSAFDITSGQEEPDPLNQRFGDADSKSNSDITSNASCAYCPYCGEKVQEDFKFCKSCGKKLP